MVVLLVIGFGSSSAMAAAYGIAVTGTMVITTMLALMVTRYLWHWSWLKAVVGALPFLVVDLAFFMANVPKIPDGGWFPQAFGLGMFALLTTWKRGREILHQKLAEDAFDLPSFLDGLGIADVRRVPGTAVYLTPNPDGVPPALEQCAARGLAMDMMTTSFFLGRETLIPKLGAGMALWRGKLFAALFRNAGSAAAYFKLPPNRVVELGAQVVL